MASAAVSAALCKDLLLLVVQFLDEEKLSGTARKLEQETGVFFNCKHFDEMISTGKWEEAEKYFSGFTKLDENRYSMKIYFELRKQKYLEALDRKDRAKAVEILVKDLKFFATLNEDLFKEMTQLLTLENFRENDQLSTYRDARTARSILVVELKKLIEANPAFRDKLQFPSMKQSRLRMLINQSLNWQHSLCKHPNQNPDIRTLLVDHLCGNANDAFAQLAANNQQLGSMPTNANGHLQPISAAAQSSFSAWVQNNPSITAHQAVSGPVVIPSSSISSKSPAESDHNLSRSRLVGISERMNNRAQNPIMDMIPKTVVRTLDEAAVTTTMDFHPVQPTILLVGSLVGEVCLWEIRSRERVMSKAFQTALIKDLYVSVRRVLWSPDGSLFGAAFSKNIVQMYAYFPPADVRTHLEIDAHNGPVNDLAFCYPGKQQLSLVTCGDDKTIKVWDVITGAKLITFEGHDSPVHSLCPHTKGNVDFLFSTSVDGKIKAWLYDSLGPKVDYDAPHRSCARMAYSADGVRLFSCGTNQEGDSHMVEWNENEGTIKRHYMGFQKRALSIVQFHVCKNQILAAGDDYSIKFWDMDNPNPVAAVDVDGALAANPNIRFNKDGNLLAVTAKDNKIKILATTDALGLIHTYEPRPFPSRTTPENPTTNGDVQMARSPEDILMSSGLWKLVEIKDPAQCRSVRLSSRITPEKPISRLVYTNTGNAILALSLSGVHLLWKWPQNERNPSGKATIKTAAEFLKPASGVMMKNDIENCATEEGLCCFALSKNDSYVMSASGGRISLFNLVTFKTMAIVLAPPPAATCLAFLPQDNNIVAVGMDDSSLIIYDVRMDSVMNKLTGHSKRVTGLAFSQELNVLVSASGDAQIILWNCTTWERLNSCFLQTPGGSTPSSMAETQVQFHQDQKHFLVVNGSRLAMYETIKLECRKQWLVPESLSPITYATFSCDSQTIYCLFLDGIVRIFESSDLQLRCLIKPTAYHSAEASLRPYPRAIAAHPQNPNQFAIGLMDGAVQVFEPLESEGRWFVPKKPVENGRANESSVQASDMSEG